MDYEFTEADAKQDARIIGKLKHTIDELEKDRIRIALLLNAAGIEHSGHVAQVERVRILIERDEKHTSMLVKKQLRIRELERLLALPCKHDWESFCKYPVAFDPPEQWFRCKACGEETEQPEDN